MRSTSRTLLALAMLVPLFLLQPVPTLEGAGLRSAPGGCCAASCACTPAASCGCEVRAPQPERASDPIALAAPQTAPALVYVQHPADVLAAPRAIEPPVACVPEPVAYKHPGRLLDLVCVRIV